MRNIPFHLISKKLIILITSFTLIACQSESGEKTGNSSLNSDPFKKGPKKEDILPEKNNKTLPEINLKDGCNPIMGTDECLLPYPSDVFLVKDSSQVSGFAVKFPEKVKPKNNFGKNMDPNDWLKIDGFSYFPTIVGTFGQEISQEGWVNILDDPNKSINTTESRVLLIRAKTGEPVPHYIDLDSEENILSRQAFIIRPIELLKEKETYIVAIRNVPGPKGKLIEAPKGFKLIRDEKTEEETILNKLKKHYDKKVFPTLESLGWKRSSLQLAWYFTTGSEKTTTRDMFRIRNLTLDFLKNNPPNVTISSVLEHKKGLKWKTIKGTVTGPLFLDSDKPGAELFRNEKGIVVQNRTAEIPFTIEIPRSFKDLEEQGKVTCFGHGFFGNRSTISNDKSVQAGNMLKTILVGIDWWGMSNKDETPVKEDFFNAPYKVMRFTDRVHQAQANWLTMGKAIKTTFTKTLALTKKFDGKEKPIYNPENIFYFGISQGHILGGVLASLSPDIDRFVLNVGGAGFSHMLPRSVPFKLFESGLNALLVKNSYEKIKLSAIIAPYFDRIDPATYAPFVLNRKLDESPKNRQVLLQAGIGDNQVPNVTSFNHARILGIGVTSPSPQKVFGAQLVKTPLKGSALTLYGFASDQSKNPEFYRKMVIPERDNGIHNAVVATEEALKQIAAFSKKDGEIIHPCNGPCENLEIR